MTKKNEVEFTERHTLLVEVESECTAQPVGGTLVTLGKKEYEVPALVFSQLQDLTMTADDLALWQLAKKRYAEVLEEIANGPGADIEKAKRIGEVKANEHPGQRFYKLKGTDAKPFTSLKVIKSWIPVTPANQAIQSQTAIEELVKALLAKKD